MFVRRFCALCLRVGAASRLKGVKMAWRLGSKDPSGRAEFYHHLLRHFEQPPTTLPTLSESFPPHDHANLHVAIESQLSSADATYSIKGIVNTHEYLALSLARLASPATGGHVGLEAPSEGPVEYVNVALDN